MGVSVISSAVDRARSPVDPVLGSGDPALAYVELALWLDRLVPGRVVCYVGDPAVRRRVLGGPAPDPADLRARAATLYSARPAYRLPAERADFLAGQTLAIATQAGLLAGDRVRYADVAAGLYGVRPEPGNPGRYDEAHRRLEAVLPGSGPLARRLADYRSAGQLSPAHAHFLAPRLLGETAARWAGIVPPAARVELRWSVASNPARTGSSGAASSQYLGELRSRITIAAAPTYRRASLVRMLAHEFAHHVLACRADLALVRAAGRREHTVSVAGTPEALYAEGIAEVLVSAGYRHDDLAGEPVPGGSTQQVDVAAEAEIESALSDLAGVRQDAAMLLWDGRCDDRQRGQPGGAARSAAVEHLCRWLLLPPERADVLLSFCDRYPAAITEYVEGPRLVRAAVGAGAGLVSLMERPALPLRPDSRRGSPRRPAA